MKIIMFILIAMFPLSGFSLSLEEVASNELLQAKIAERAAEKVALDSGLMSGSLRQQICLNQDITPKEKFRELMQKSAAIVAKELENYTDPARKGEYERFEELATAISFQATFMIRSFMMGYTMATITNAVGPPKVRENYICNRIAGIEEAVDPNWWVKAPIASEWP